VAGRSVVAGFDGGRITSDAGALLLGATDRVIRLVDRFAQCFRDERDSTRIEHGVATLVGQRVFGIALGYEDLVDHDELRHDPALAVLAGKLAGRRSDCAPLAGKSTLNRLELSGPEPTRYHRVSCDGAAVERLFVSLFLEAQRTAPKQIVLDLDATDDLIHGHQEGRFFHGYYDGYCYLPLYIFCGRHLLAAKLRRSNIDASAGAIEEVERIVGQIRARWPRVRILLRADSGFARDALMAWCEGNRVDFVFGLARNERLVAEIAVALIQAEAEAGRTGKPARRFRDFSWSTLDSWSRRRRVIAKAEWTGGEANPRFIVTSLKPTEVAGRHLYERSIAPEATWRTASRRRRATSLPTAHRPPPCAPTSCASGSPRWPTCCSAPCAASALPIPSSPRRPAAPSVSSFSRSAPLSRSRRGASGSRWRPAARTRPSGRSSMRDCETPAPDGFIHPEPQPTRSSSSRHSAKSGRTNTRPRQARPSRTSPNPRSLTLVRNAG
jgi:hypothetical protein